MRKGLERVRTLSSEAIAAALRGTGCDPRATSSAPPQIFEKTLDVWGLTFSYQIYF